MYGQKWTHNEVSSGRFKMLNRNACKGALALTAGLVIASVAYATVTFDALTGMGFVGKGDVQYTFGWNNGALQNNANLVDFRASSVVVSESTWTCDRDAGDQTQERNRTTTTTVAGIVDSIGRLKNQITGFNLLGYDGVPAITNETEGPPLNSCPTGWTSLGVTTTVLPGEGTVLEVSPDDGDTWSVLMEKPIV
jgi:hypothetical protein